jgi:hypothetical protein
MPTGADNLTKIMNSCREGIALSKQNINLECARYMHILKLWIHRAKTTL